MPWDGALRPITIARYWGHSMPTDVDMVAPQDASCSEERAGKVGFLFGIGHGHYTQYLNFKECIPSELAGRAEWVPLYGDHSGDRLSKMGLIPAGRRYSRHQIWHAWQGVRRHEQWDALFIASLSSRFLPIARRHRTFFYCDISESGLNELDYDPPSEGRFLRAIKNAMQNRVIHASAGVFTMSQWAAAGIHKDTGLPRDRIHVVLPGANLNRWRYVDRSGRDSSRPVRILMVGGWFRLKGGPELLEWAEQTKMRGWEMDIVTWQGGLPSWVQEVAGPEVEGKRTISLGPRLPNVRLHFGLTANTPEVMGLYEQADIFCLPTRADASSMASLEAMACGLPVLVNATGGIPELVNSEETGILMPRGDTSALACQLERLIEDRELRHRLGVNARRACEAFYNTPRQVRDIFAVLDRA
jgi:glycosyltransferase involved in cell wall biosynthesis